MRDFSGATAIVGAANTAFSFSSERSHLDLALEAITLEPDYGVEIAMLIDMAQLFGVHALAQVDLGIRRHRNRPLEDLRPMAVEVLRAALERYKVDVPIDASELSARVGSEDDDDAVTRRARDGK